jgi:phage terminase small subunit
MAKLTDKQEMFCKEYLIDLNATQAAIRAGYSQKTAKEIGYEHLTKPHLQEYIAELKEERSERIQITSDEVLRELKNFAYSDITETFLMSPEALKELNPEVRRLINKYKTNTRSWTNESGDTESETTVEIWFVDKIKALEMINKHIGFYEKDNEQSKTDISLPNITIQNNGDNIDLSS